MSRFCDTIKKLFLFVIVIFISSASESFSQSYYDYELTSINFSGNETFSKSDLLPLIESKESPSWFWVFLNSFTPFGDERIYFDSSKISVDLNALTEFYRSNGFFRVTVTSEILPDTSKKTVELNYKITEGEPFFFGRLELTGFQNLSSVDFSKLVQQSITVDSSRRFSESEIQQNISSIRRFLANNGFVMARYDSTLIKIDTLTFRTDVNIAFQTGDQYRISEIIINKAGVSIDQITYELIDEIVGIKPGDIYDQSNIDRSELRLLKTELFTSVDINPIISEIKDGRVPLEVNTTIGSLNQLSPEVKGDNEFNTFNSGLGISYTRKNFFGDARKFNISTSFRLIDIINIDLANIFKSGADRDSTYQGIFDLNVKMEQPFLFGRPILTSTEIYLRSQTLKTFTENSYGGAQRFDIEMPSYTFITLFRPFLSIDVAERENNFNSPDRAQRISLSVNSFTPGLGVELGSSKTDDILFPTEGNYIFITPEIFHSKTSLNLLSRSSSGSITQFDTTFSGNTYFYRIQTGISNYISLDNSKKSVFASKFRFGYAQTFTSSGNEQIASQQLIPPNKTFYAGGSNSVRGWRTRELVPREKIEYLGITTEAEDIRGGTIWLEGSFEYRKKLNDYFGYALFADYGNSWNNWNSVMLKDIAVAIGFGIRIYTPIAPFRLDFGTKFYNPFDEKTIFKKDFLNNLEFHFGIGEAF